MKRKSKEDSPSSKECGLDEVVLGNFENRPWCAHGPALLLRRRKGTEIEEFFACSAQREGLCTISHDKCLPEMPKNNVSLEKVLIVCLTFTVNKTFLYKNSFN